MTSQGSSKSLQQASPALKLWPESQLEAATQYEYLPVAIVDNRQGYHPKVVGM
jgi:hypothetical protein